MELSSRGAEKPSRTPSDIAQDERRGVEIVDDFPFMLRVSKHS